MKELSIEETKSVGLKILLDVDKFCRDNNLQYSLAFGTLIGAVRHNGFIPWDDDIDIMMPREDFDKFFHIYKSNNGFIASSPSTRDTYMFFGRVYDTKLTHSKPWRPQGTNTNTGVWIDVFPIDFVPENDEEYIKETSNFLNLYSKVHRKRNAMVKLSEIFYHPRACAWYLKEKFFTRNVDPIKIVVEFEKHIKDFKNSKFKGYFADHVYKYKERLDASVFCGTINKEFEGHNFMILKNYDSFLKNFYGEYMKLPPVEKRTAPHLEHKFYWKDEKQKE